MTARPLIGITSCRREIGPHPYHVVQDKYVTAVRECALAIPLIIPSDASECRSDVLVHALDGILLTGSYSNIEPKRYGKPAGPGDVLRDPERDETTARLIHSAVREGCPILGICRGLQEMNVAFGGTLHEALHEQPGSIEHREQGEVLEEHYAPAHDVDVIPGSELARVTGATKLHVNSLHAQGIDQLGDGLVAEAHASDGLVEAIRLETTASYAMAVQWHPEYRAIENRDSQALFGAFGKACAERAQTKAVA